jgi:hypothetical protein
MTNQVRLHVGYVGITREGKRVEITKETNMPDYPFSSSEYNSYCSGGNYWRDEAACSQDIVGPWVDTPVEPLADYNDGKWHRWAGGECPVHSSSVVHARYILRGDLTEYTQRAKDFRWDAIDNPIIAFRVTKEYVEPPKVPREFWLIQGKIYNYYHTNTNAIHVREVLTDD